MFDFIFKLNRHRNKRHYSREEIKNIDLALNTEIGKIEEDFEKSILNLLYNNGEHIIVYLTTYNQEEKWGAFFIELKIIHKKGIVLNRVRLIAIYKSKDTIEIGDIEVFGENMGRGYGSILLDSLINFAIENSVKTISGWISNTDKAHFDKLDYFYKKHGFDVIWDSTDTNIVNKSASIIWINPAIFLHNE